MNLIVAVSSDYAIGKDNKLLFNIPTDLKFFKEKTLNNVVVMGANTYMSLPVKPLKNRVNIVLCNDVNFKAEGAIVAHSLDELFDLLKKYRSEQIFVGGGASIYNLLLDYCDIAYITKVDASVSADTFIRNVDNEPNWELVDKGPTIWENDLSFQFCTYRNNKVKKF